MNYLPTIPLFPPGRLVATPGALASLEQTNKSPLEFLSRHLRATGAISAKKTRLKMN